MLGLYRLVQLDVVSCVYWIWVGRAGGIIANTDGHTDELLRTANILRLLLLHIAALTVMVHSRRKTVKTVKTELAGLAGKDSDTEK